MCGNYKEDSLLKSDTKDLQAERTASASGTSLVRLYEEQHNNSKESCVWRAVNKLGNSNTGGGGL